MRVYEQERRSTVRRRRKFECPNSVIRAILYVILARRSSISLTKFIGVMQNWYGGTHRVVRNRVLGVVRTEALLELAKVDSEYVIRLRHKDVIREIEDELDDRRKKERVKSKFDGTQQDVREMLEELLNVYGTVNLSAFVRALMRMKGGEYRDVRNRVEKVLKSGKYVVENWGGVKVILPR